MKHYSTSYSTTIILSALLSAQTRAQTGVDGDNTGDTCARHTTLNSSITVNATGQRPFTYSGSEIPETFYFSTTLNDRRHHPEVDGAVHWIQGYISGPQDTNASYCVYQFSGVDAVQQEDFNGCEGVLSVECLNFLQDSMPYPNVLRGQPECPEPPSTDDGKSVCPESMFSQGVVYFRSPLHFSNGSCAGSPPGVTVPEGYRTLPVVGSGKIGSRADQNASDYTWYSRHSERPIPWVIATSYFLGDTSRYRRMVTTRTICVAPNQRQNGSIETTIELPEGKANGLTSFRAMYGALAMSFTASVLLL